MQEIVKKGYIGNPAQLVTLRRVNVTEGRAKGTGIIEVKTAGGLDVDILPDAGLDIGQCRYKGINMSWMSKNGYDNPAVIGHYESEYFNTFPGGLMYTCGLRSTGVANRDNGEWHPFHGRYHSLQADHVCADIVDDEIVISGTMRESALFGHCLELKRTIRIPVFGSSIKIEDTLANLAPSDEEIAIIYHCNFGYPLLCEDLRLILPEVTDIKTRNEFARAGISRACEFDTPAPNEEERCFFYDIKDDFKARLENKKLGVNVNLEWAGENLPILTEWRSMASGDYALGLEPTNCYIMGRHAERENGSLKVLKAFETIKNTVSISFE